MKPDIEEAVAALLQKATRLTTEVTEHRAARPVEHMQQVTGLATLALALMQFDQTYPQSPEGPTRC